MSAKPVVKTSTMSGEMHDAAIEVRRPDPGGEEGERGEGRDGQVLIGS